MALLCRDFLRLGYSKLIVDPGVRLTYTADDALQRYTQKVNLEACLHDTPGLLTVCNLCPSSTHLHQSPNHCKNQADGIFTSYLRCLKECMLDAVSWRKKQKAGGRASSWKGPDACHSRYRASHTSSVWRRWMSLWHHGPM